MKKKLDIKKAYDRIEGLKDARDCKDLIDRLMSVKALLKLQKSDEYKTVCLTLLEARIRAAKLYSRQDRPRRQYFLEVLGISRQNMNYWQNVARVPRVKMMEYFLDKPSGGVAYILKRYHTDNAQDLVI